MSNTAPIPTIAPTTAAQDTPDDAGNAVAMTTAAASTRSAATANVAIAPGTFSNSSTAAYLLNGPPSQAAPPSASAHAASVAALIARYKRRNREYENELNVILMDLWTTRYRLARHGYDLINRRMHGATEFPPAVKTLLGALALAEYYRQEVLLDLLSIDADWKDVELAEAERLEREAKAGGAGL